MASPVVVLDDTLYDIADAIRAKTGGTADMTPSEMPTEIASIPSGGSFIGIPREIDANGVYRISSQSFGFSLPADVTDMATHALYYAFHYSGLTSVGMRSLSTVSGQNALASAFIGCRNLTSVDLRSLTGISGTGAFSNTFLGCTSLTSIAFESLSSVSATEAFYHTFQGCSNLTSADFRSLTTVSGTKAFAQTFQYCGSLTSVNFSALTTITGNQAFYFAFQGCTSLTSLSFPALTPSSFGSYTNQFTYMLSGVTGCTVHFPAAIQSTIGSWSDVQNGFNGTNTTVLFDL